MLQFAGASLHIGHRLVLMDKWTPEEMLRLIDAHRVTHTHMVPTQFHRLLALPERGAGARTTCSSMRHVIHGAAPCPDQVKRAMIDWWGDCVEEYYAATEGGGTFATAEEWLEKPGTVGKAWPDREIAHLRRRRQPAAARRTRHRLHEDEHRRLRYHKDEDKTRKNRIGDFFTVGDVGCLDEDGYLFLRDRKIDMIISGGVNIYPAEIEAALLAHPAVADAAVFGIPHDDWGEEVKAVVEPAPGHEPGADAGRRDPRPLRATGSPGSSGPRASTSSTRCPATPTASSTSGSCATRTGRAVRGRCERSREQRCEEWCEPRCGHAPVRDGTTPHHTDRPYVRRPIDPQPTPQPSSAVHPDHPQRRRRQDVLLAEPGRHPPLGREQPRLVAEVRRVRVRRLGVRQQGAGHRAAAAVPAHRLDVTGPVDTSV